jgi:hypothetical protein
VKFRGPEGLWLAIAYIAGGSFLYIRSCWGPSERITRFSPLGILVSIVVFLPSLITALLLFIL